jgi:hypothetical protein
VRLIFYVSGFSAIWIGLSDVESHGTWVWQDGGPVTWTYWSDGEPDGSSEHAVVSMFHSGHDSRWGDIDHTQSYQFPYTLCQVNAGMCCPCMSFRVYLVSASILV